MLGTGCRIAVGTWGETINDDAEHADKNGKIASIVTDYKAKRLRKYLFIIGLGVALLIFAGWSATLGPFNIGFQEAYSIIFGRLANWTDVLTIREGVVWDLRLPRIVTAMIAGAGLGIAGAAMQSMMKNPLADPYTTGISSGAAFGATLSIILGINLIAGSYGTVVNAFIFSLIPAAIIVLLSKFRSPSPTMMVLAGIAIMYIFNAMSSYLMLVANPNSLAAVYQWTVGTLEKSSWEGAAIMFVVTAIGSVLLYVFSGSLNAMNSGDSFAKSIGVSVEKIRIMILVTVSLIAASVVSFTGIIGFVGLVSPHIVRIFIGADNKLLLPASAMFGSVLLLAADIISRNISESLIPVGIVTAFIGGPLFLYLIIKQKKEVW